MTKDDLESISCLLRQAQAEIDRIIDRIQTSMLEAAGLTNEWLVVGDHHCEDSPIKLCIYNDEVDPSWDDCIICGLPDERK